MLTTPLHTVRLALFTAVVAAVTAMVAPPSAKALDQGAYILNTSTGAPYATAERNGFLDLVVAEAFRRIGKKGEVAMYDASKRAMINANDDVDQGVAMRVINLEKRYPNLLRIPERIIENDFVAYSLGLNATTDSWDALKPYSVTYIHGWVIFDRNMPAGQQVATVKTPEQMFAMLQKRRVDMMLYERWQGLQHAKESGLKVAVHEPPLASVDMFMYVHKNHADLVEPLTKALRAMKEDGTYQAIFAQTLTPLVPVNDN